MVLDLVYSSFLFRSWLTTSVIFLRLCDLVPSHTTDGISLLPDIGSYTFTIFQINIGFHRSKWPRWQPLARTTSEKTDPRSTQWNAVSGGSTQILYLRTAKQTYCKYTPEAHYYFSKRTELLSAKYTLNCQDQCFCGCERGHFRCWTCRISK